MRVLLDDDSMKDQEQSIVVVCRTLMDILLPVVGKS